ncbi:30S Ribosomal protein S17, putative [Bodo saltans]|uniref:30S Ribosomal protein S17, putative n=1 Tax=Bodo saltans TaxID=75058 RepID=A0A0S4J3Y6_BODSA|nr:30S Ribosomal protein S17, putative [Bodo saltans]|eukprot:CUG40859.1 30S Ribosomal protein S17, putative [Bodo saltans]
MLRRSLPAVAWWNFQTEHRQRATLMYGGSRAMNTHNATHRIYIKKFKKSAFPNRTRHHWNVTMTGVAAQRPRRMPWPYDITSLIFNQPRQGSDKIGYVVGTQMIKTAVVASNHLVYYPKFNQRVARTSRFFAHDEDLACVDGDLVHIKQCRKLSKYKHYYVFSILEPNIEGRERLKLGLRSVPPPLFGHPVSRRIVKLNLSKEENTKEKLAAIIQEHVQDAYRFAGATNERSRVQNDAVSFDDAHRMIAPNAPQTEGALQGGDESAGLIGGKEEFTELEHDSRSKKGEDYWMNLQPQEKYNFKGFKSSP